MKCSIFYSLTFARNTTTTNQTVNIINNINSDKKLTNYIHILKVALVLTLTIIFGCSKFQNFPSLKKDVKIPKKIKEPIEANWKKPPLFQDGTKPLLNKQIENFKPELEDHNLPCIDAKTGKERGFLLADLKSELISLSYSNMYRVINSLEVMGLETVLATAPIAKPYTVDKNTLASDILTQMNKRKITNVCVYNKNNKRKTIGVIHIHNLLNILK